jgi:nicotinamide phosphoribosyltransferase
MYQPQSLHGTDGYKVDHKRQYPENTVKVFSNFTPRKSRVPGVDFIIFFGLTYFIKDVLIEEFKRTFFDKPKASVVGMYKRRLDTYLGDNDITYEHIEALHDLGYVPVKIKALPEGSLVDQGVPVLTITNELPEFFWVPNFLETIISCEIWPMSTSATSAFNYRLIFDSYALATTGSTAFSSTFQAHDFSMRGQMGRHAAAMNGAAHLIAFRGTDTIPAIDFLEYFYNANADNELIGASIPATEHSVMCMGLKDGELETFRRLIQEVYPKGPVAAVADTWDFWNVVRPITGICAQLIKEILAREGKLVIRPDSGDPVKIITGYTSEEYAEVDGEFFVRSKDNLDVITAQKLSTEECKGAIQCLWEIFGGITNDLGFRELDPHIGLIYGDSITTARAREICERLKAKGFASTNWVAGVGSYTYQYVTRDTYGWAMKATYGEIGHPLSEADIEVMKVAGDIGTDFEGEVYSIEPREIFKDPITDRDPVTGVSIKKSAKGLLQVVKGIDGTYHLIDQVTDEEEELGELKVVYEFGELIVDSKLSDIRALVDTNVLKQLS